MSPVRSALILTALAASATAAESPALPSIAASRDKAKPVPVQTISGPERVVVGDASSSLSRDSAVRLAQKVAAALPGAGVAQIDPGYNGCLAPAVPASSVLVIEPARFEQLRPFDLALFTTPAGEIRARRILAKGADKAVVGFEYNDVAPADVDAAAFIGRVAVIILYDPKAPTKEAEH
jgi:hypothetical protein